MNGQLIMSADQIGQDHAAKQAAARKKYPANAKATDKRHKTSGGNAPA